MPLFGLRFFFDILNISGITEYILLETQSMCSPSKGQFILSRETIQNAFFFFRILPLFELGLSSDSFEISLLLLSIFYLGLGVCVHYPKSDPSYQGRQFKIHYIFRIMSLFRPTTFNALSSTPQRALAPFCSVIVFLLKSILKLQYLILYY